MKAVRRIGASVIILSFLILPQTIFLLTSCKPTEASLKASPSTKEVTLTAPVVKYDSVYCLTQLAMYRELAARSRWEEARVPWQIVYRGCGPQRPNFYIDGGNIYRHLVVNGTDSLLREQRLDTLLSLYEHRIARFSDSGSVNARLGLDLINLRPSEKRRAYGHLVRSVSSLQQESTPAVLLAMLNTSIALNREGITDTAEVMHVYLRVQDLLSLALSAEDSISEPPAEAIVLADRSLLSWADCEALGRYFRDEVAGADTARLRTMTRLFSALQCYDLDVFQAATLRLHQLNPGPQSALLLGYSAFNHKDYNTALSYFTQAAGEYTDVRQKSACYVAAGRTCEAMQNFRAANDMAEKAIKAQPSNGRAYMLKGDVYRAAATTCGQNEEITEAAVYWVAADQYLMAAQYDAGLKDEANGKLNLCRQHFPSTNLLFFHHLNPGDTYTVGCWIQQKTTVRARPEQF